MKTVSEAEVCVKRKAFQRLKSCSEARQCIYLAFEHRGLLQRGFNQLRRSILYRKCRRFRRRKILSKCLRRWLQYIMSRPVTPILKGLVALSCFKWIRWTIAHGSSRQYSTWIHDENYFSPHMRRHNVLGYVSLPMKNMPLFLHAVALVDAYLLRSSFLALKTFYVAVVRIRAKSQMENKRYRFDCWRHAAIAQQFQRRASQTLRWRQNYRYTLFGFRQWRTAYKLSMYLRTVKQQKLVAGFWNIWRTIYISQMRATENWTRAVALQSVRSASGAIAEWWHVASGQKTSRLLVLRAETFRRLILRRKAFVKWAYRVRSPWFMASSQWSLRAPIKPIPSAPVLILRESRASLWHHTILGCCMVSSRLHHALLSWRWRVLRCRWLSTRAKAVENVTVRGLLEKSFGSWLTQAVHLMSIQRRANKVVINRFRRLLKSAFISWYNSARYMLQLRLEAVQAERQRIKDLNDKLELWRYASVEYTLKRVLVAWRVLVRRIKHGKILKRSLVKSVFRQYLYLALRKWELVTNVSTIVTCMQKLWRGYFVRNVQYRWQRQYIEWIFSGIVRRSLMQYRMNTKKRVISCWKGLVNDFCLARERNTVRVVLSRSLKQLLKRSRCLNATRSRQSTVALELTYRLCRDVFSAFRRNKYIRNAYIVAAVTHRRRCLLSGFRKLGRMFTFYGERTHCFGIYYGGFRMNQHHRRELRCYILGHALHRWLKTVKFSLHKHRLMRLARKHFLKKFIGVIRSWKWRASRWALTENHPIMLAHAFYIKRLKYFGFHALRKRLFRYHTSLSHQTRLLRIVARKYQRKQIRSALVGWSRVVVRNRMLRGCAFRILVKPVFCMWHQKFIRHRVYSIKIFKIRVKTMKRVAKGVFLAWSLYTVRSRRQTRLFIKVREAVEWNIKRRALHLWFTAKRDILLVQNYTILVRQHESNLQQRALCQWQRALHTAHMHSRKVTHKVFHHWAKIVLDAAVERGAHDRALVYHLVSSLHSAIHKWVKRCRLVRWFRDDGVSEQYAMVCWRVKKKFRYWRKWSWWMGRRVLHGRVRFVVPASSDSSRNLSRSQLGVYFGSGVGLLNESSTLQERRFSLRSPLLICGRTPLAHETCQRRAIRVWHRYAVIQSKVRRRELLISCFVAWKKFSHVLVHKRMAFANRLKSFQRFYMLQYAFHGIAECNRSKSLMRLACAEYNRKRMRLVMGALQENVLERSREKRSKVVVCRWLSETVNYHRTQEVRFAFSTWKIRVNLVGPGGIAVAENYKYQAFLRWRQLLIARRVYHERLLHKAYYRWVNRVHKVHITRKEILAKQHAARIALTRFKRIRYDAMVSAFSRWKFKHHATYDRLAYTPADDAEEWRSHIATSRLSAVSLASRRNVTVSSLFRGEAQSNSPVATPKRTRFFDDDNNSSIHHSSYISHQNSKLTASALATPTTTVYSPSPATPSVRGRDTPVLHGLGYSPLFRRRVPNTKGDMNIDEL